MKRHSVFSLLIAHSFLPQALGAPLAPVPESPAAPSRILPQHSRDAFWDRTSLGMDIVGTHLGSATGERFETNGPGVAFSFEQHARSAFWGAIHLGFDNWRTTAASGAEAGISIFPLRITTEILGEAPLWLLPGGDSLGFFRPFVTGGVGYMTFVSSDAGQVEFLKKLRSESIGLYGTGVRLVWRENVAIRISWQMWRGLETSRFRAQTWLVGIQFGDLSRK